MVGKRTLIALAALVAMSVPASAQYYIGTGIISGNVVVMPAPVIVEQVPVPVAVPVPQPVPVPVPVAPVPRIGPCALYVDPYDLFGQLFGDPDLVESCWVR